MEGTMKAAVKVDDREIYELKQLPIPTPGPKDCLLKVSACGLCGTDVAIRNNTFMGRHGRVKYPIVPGHEFVGTVIEVGNQVNLFKPGDRVFTTCAVGCGVCKNCRTGKSCRHWIHWGIDVDGGMAEYVSVHEDALLEVPDFIPDEHAAIMEIASEATKAINDFNIPAGSNIVIFGPGSFGLFLLQTMKMTSPMKLIMVGLSSDQDRLKKAKELGADEILVSDGDYDIVEKIFELTEGRGADFTVEAAGTPEAVTPAIHALAGKGKMLMCGSGYRGEKVHFRPWNFVRDSQSISSVEGFSNLDYLTMVDLYRSGMLKFEPIISRVMTLDEINEACDLAKAKKTIKIVIKF